MAIDELQRPDDHKGRPDVARPTIRNRMALLGLKLPRIRRASAPVWADVTEMSLWMQCAEVAEALEWRAYRLGERSPARSPSLSVMLSTGRARRRPPTRRNVTGLGGRYQAEVPVDDASEPPGRQWSDPG